MERISGRQLSVLGAGYMLDATLISVPAQMIGAAQQDAWLSYLPAAVVILGVMWMLSRVSARFPDQDLFQAMVERYAMAGRAVVLLFVLFYFFILARDMRSVIDFANIALLPNTPLTVILIMTLITIIQIAIGGVEVMARLTQLFIVPFFILIALLPIVLAKDFEFKALTPFLENGVVSTMQGSWYALPYVGEIVMMPMLFAGRTYRFRHGVYAILIGAGLLTLLLVLNLMVLGRYLSSIAVYPNMEMIRQIRVTDFLDRFDLPIAAVWLVSMFIKLSISLHIIVHGLKCVVPNLSAQLMVPPVAMLTGVCSFWFFQNTVQLLHFNRPWPLIAIVFQVGLPFLIFLFVRPKAS